jgi:hypothetical protein
MQQANMGLKPSQAVSFYAQLLCGPHHTHQLMAAVAACSVQLCNVCQPAMQYTAQARPVEFVGHIIPDLLQVCMHSPDEAADLQHLKLAVRLSI